MIDLIHYRKKFVDWAVIFGADRLRASDAAMGISEERAEEISPENLARHFVKTDYIYESDIPKSLQNLGDTEYFSPDLKHFRRQDKLNFNGTIEEIKEHPLNDLAEIAFREMNQRIDQIKAFVRMPGRKSVQLRINTREGVVNVTDTKNGDFTGTPWKLIRSFQKGSHNEDIVNQALDFVQTLIKPIEESDKGLSEAIKLLDNAGYVCERYSGDNYVSDHMIGVEVPGLVHSYVSGIDHYFDTEEEDDYEAQLVIYSGSFRVWCKIEPMKDPLIERGELPDFFWKKSSYQDGELSRVSRWIKRKIESLRQKCLMRVKELGDLT